LNSNALKNDRHLGAANSFQH